MRSKPSDDAGFGAGRRASTRTAALVAGCTVVLLTGCGGRSGRVSTIPVPPIDAPGSAPSTAPPSIAPPTVPRPTAPPSGSVVAPPSPTRQEPPAPLPGASTADVNVTRDGLGHLRAVRLANQDGYDRLVLEFADQVPGYLVGYRPLPARTDTSGAEIPMPGARTMVLVRLRPATGYRTETSTPTYTGANEIAGNTMRVTQVKAAGDFEAVLTWAVGLRSKTPFRVSVLAGPPRLVIDFQH